MQKTAVLGTWLRVRRHLDAPPCKIKVLYSVLLQETSWTINKSSRPKGKHTMPESFSALGSLNPHLIIKTLLNSTKNATLCFYSPAWPPCGRLHGCRSWDTRDHPIPKGQKAPGTSRRTPGTSLVCSKVICTAKKHPCELLERFFSDCFVVQECTHKGSS